MSDNIPFDIQMQIIKKVYDVKSLIRFRSVSKPWKSFIESSEFINWYGVRNTQPPSFFLRYEAPDMAYDVKCICLVEDDNNETFKVQEQEFALSLVSPLIKQFSAKVFVGACHGLVCLYGFMEHMLVIWNPSTRKSFGIADPNHLNSRLNHIYGFGVCPDTSDPTVVKIIQTRNKPWHVEVFSLSSGVWNVIPSSNLLRQSIQLTYSHHVVIDSLTYEQCVRLSLSKLRESLVVYGSSAKIAEEFFGDIWVMQHDSSFKKLFSIHAWVDKILGFRESGEPVVEIQKQGDPLFTTLGVYDLCSHQINDLGIYGGAGTFDMGSYKESLLLLDHLDSSIYCDSTD
nr:hypothetical protein [Tanacetum cinerariifolium]